MADRSRLWRNTSLERMELLVEQMKWVRLMNNVRSSVEKIIIRELIYV